MKKLLILLVIPFLIFSCTQEDTKSASGIGRVVAKVKAQASGLTVEQENIRYRTELENKAGSIKHLYVISAMSGQVLIYSTVKGKVTSSGKSLTPKQLADGYSSFDFKMNNNTYHTREVMHDDGTYGASVPYLYWKDSKGHYHQHYVSGGQILHISDYPLNVKSITINMEQRGTK